MRSNANNKRVDNTVNAVLFLQSSLPESVTDEIKEVLAQTPFDKLNVSVAVPRKVLEDVSETDTRTYVTAGIVKSYNPETEEFNINLFYGPNAKTIKSLGDKIITLNVKTYSSKKDRIMHLSKIQKIIIEPAPVLKKEELAEDSAPVDFDKGEKVLLLDNAVLVKDTADVTEYIDSTEGVAVNEVEAITTDIAPEPHTMPQMSTSPSVGNRIVIPDSVKEAIKE